MVSFTFSYHLRYIVIILLYTVVLSSYNPPPFVEKKDDDNLKFDFEDSNFFAHTASSSFSSSSSFPFTNKKNVNSNEFFQWIEQEIDERIPKVARDIDTVLSSVAVLLNNLGIGVAKTESAADDENPPHTTSTFLSSLSSSSSYSSLSTTLSSSMNRRALDASLTDQNGYPEEDIIELDETTLQEVLDVQSTYTNNRDFDHRISPSPSSSSSSSSSTTDPSFASSVLRRRTQSTSNNPSLSSLLAVPVPECNGVGYLYPPRPARNNTSIIFPNSQLIITNITTNRTYYACNHHPLTNNNYNQIVNLQNRLIIPTNWTTTDPPNNNNNGIWAIDVIPLSLALNSIGPGLTLISYDPVTNLTVPPVLNGKDPLPSSFNLSTMLPLNQQTILVTTANVSNIQGITMVGQVLNPNLVNNPVQLSLILNSLGPTNTALLFQRTVCTVTNVPETTTRITNTTTNSNQSTTSNSDTNSICICPFDYYGDACQYALHYTCGITIADPLWSVCQATNGAGFLPPSPLPSIDDSFTGARSSSTDTVTTEKDANIRLGQYPVSSSSFPSYTGTGIAQPVSSEWLASKDLVYQIMGVSSDTPNQQTPNRWSDNTLPPVNPPPNSAEKYHTAAVGDPACLFFNTSEIRKLTGTTLLAKGRVQLHVRVICTWAKDTATNVFASGQTLRTPDGISYTDIGAKNILKKTQSKFIETDEYSSLPEEKNYTPEQVSLLADLDTIIRNIESPLRYYQPPIINSTLVTPYIYRCNGTQMTRTYIENVLLTRYRQTPVERVQSGNYPPPYYGLFCLEQLLENNYLVPPLSASFSSSGTASTIPINGFTVPFALTKRPIGDNGSTLAILLQPGNNYNHQPYNNNNPEDFTVIFPLLSPSVDTNNQTYKEYLSRILHGREDIPVDLGSVSSWVTPTSAVWLNGRSNWEGRIISIPLFETYRKINDLQKLVQETTSSSKLMDISNTSDRYFTELETLSLRMWKAYTRYGNDILQQPSYSFPLLTLSNILYVTFDDPSYIEPTMETLGRRRLIVSLIILIPLCLLTFVCYGGYRMWKRNFRRALQQTSAREEKEERKTD